MYIRAAACDWKETIIYRNAGKITEFLYRSIDVLVFSAIIIAKVMFYGRQISPDYFDAASLKPIVASSILPIIGLIFLFKENKRVKSLYIFDIVLSLLLMADTMYFRYFKDIISVGAVRNGAMLGGVLSCVTTLVKFKDILYIMDLLVLFPVIRIMYRNKGNKLSGIARFMIFLICFATGVLTDGRYIHQLSVEQPLLITTMSNKLYLTRILGNVNYHALDIYNFANNLVESKKMVSSETKEEIKTYLQSNNQSNQAVVLKGAANGKNLIMIQVEALQQFAVNTKINGVEVTPNINRWIKKSLYFDNYFYQVSSGNTSDAEFMSLNSLYPAESGAAYYRYTGDTLDSLPIELTAKGYTTSAMHGYTESFWNRNAMYETEGFQNFYGESSFNQDEQVGMGLSDKSFLTQAIKKVEAQKQPYYSFLITLSSHYPFNDQAGYGDFNVGEYEGTLMGDYLRGIHYTDQQLGAFLDQLKKDGTLDNSVVVLYGDHNAIPKEYIDQLYKLQGLNNPTDIDWYQLQKVPMFIHFPSDANKGVNHTYSGQMDLYPTLANLFDINLKYSFGKDILNPVSQNVIFRNGSFTDGNTFYVSWTNTWYDIATGNTIIETEDLKRKKQAALTELNYSDNILNHNLIKAGITK